MINDIPLKINPAIIIGKASQINKVRGRQIIVIKQTERPMIITIDLSRIPTILIIVFRTKVKV
jgi:hypothetical protein